MLPVMRGRILLLGNGFIISRLMRSMVRLVRKESLLRLLLTIQGVHILLQKLVLITLSGPISILMECQRSYQTVPIIMDRSSFPKSYCLCVSIISGIVNRFLFMEKAKIFVIGSM